MAELRPQLFNKLMAHQKGGRQLAADETSRILGILGGTALGFGTPASLDQYTRVNLRTLPHERNLNRPRDGSSNRERTSGP